MVLSAARWVVRGIVDDRRGRVKAFQSSVRIARVMAVNAVDARARGAIVEGCGLGLLLLVCGAGLVIARSNLEAFERWFTAEDGIVETLTALAFLAGAVACGGRLLAFRRARTPRRRRFIALLSLVLVAAAGEELSWGQRLFGVPTPAVIARHNAQKETNVHNIRVGGVKLNVIVEPVITFVFLLCLTASPIAYRRLPTVQRVADTWGVPIPRARHVLTFAVAGGLIYATPSTKNWEVFEFAVAMTLALVTLFPANETAPDRLRPVRTDT
jgi:hypothetical protein